MSNNKNRFFNIFFSRYVAASFALLSFLVGYSLGQFTQDRENYAKDQDSPAVVVNTNDTPDEIRRKIDFNVFWEAWNTIIGNYVDQPVDQSKLLYASIRGMMGGLDDPHSVFLDPQEGEDFLQELSGKFFGIGAEIAVKNDQLQVVAPLSDTPAERAGLRPGDFILAVNGEDMSGQRVDYAVSKIRGPKGTPVTLTIFRQGDKETKDLVIVRDEIKITSVSWELLDDHIAYIKLKYFNGDTSREFNRTADEIIGVKPQHIILDMRNNPGGFLDVAIEISSQFIEDGAIVLEKFADDSIVEHDAVGRARLKNIPVTVLINEGSASASEIVAGALKDYGIATIVGKKSYGKGSVQTLFDLRDGSSIKLTIAKWLTPNGNTIEKEGIAPDVEVELTNDDYNNNRDPQLDKALEMIK